ncbi:HAD family hydrolase [Streptomyces specialis]|uniref:HAD family hydrolase n=1 Tax=Streptomyces specialis TaxID=498367 RepID=UPI00073E1558|nr:HAD family hydrolase [Streptomyces specialis]
MHSLFDIPSAYRPTERQMAEPVPPLTTVLFDFSNTIFHLADLETWLRRVGAATGRSALLDRDGALDATARQLAEAYARPDVAALQTGRDLSVERHWRAMRAWWERVDFLRGAEEAAYDVLRAPDMWLPYRDTGPVLRALRERGLRIGIVSDFAWDLRVHLKHHGLDHLIETCVLSYELGREKPDPELFRTACAALGTDPRAALMVGDNPVRDGGASASGLRAYILPGEPRTGERGLLPVLGLLD